MSEELNEIKEELEKLQKKVERLIENDFYENMEKDLDLKGVKCSKCNMVFEGVTGYVCSQIDCPTFFNTRC
jgi:hypothetical protein